MYVMGDLSHDFNEAEFACPCGCGTDEVRPWLISRLQHARNLYDNPIHINSGVRCPGHNIAVGGVPDSAHLTGNAADIRVTSSRERYRLLQSLIVVGFGRIGIGETFIHVDVDPEKDPQVIWLYP